MKRNLLPLAMAAAIIFVTGCYSSGVDRNWGRAYRVKFTALTAAPEAPKSLEVPAGMGAGTAEQTMTSHRKRSVEKSEQQVAPSLISIDQGIGDN